MIKSIKSKSLLMALAFAIGLLTIKLSYASENLQQQKNYDAQLSLVEYLITAGTSQATAELIAFGRVVSARPRMCESKTRMQPKTPPAHHPNDEDYEGMLDEVD